MSGGLIVARTGVCKKGLLAILGAAVLGLMPAFVANAANPEPVTVGMSFLDPITITENESLRFGLLDVNMANTETIIIAPDDSVTGTGTGRIIGGTQAAADLTVTATASQSITILVDNVGTATGYALGTWMCKYGAGSDTACDGVGYGVTSPAGGAATLLVGAVLTGVAGGALAGADPDTFDVTVIYQ